MGGGVGCGWGDGGVGFSWGAGGVDGGWLRKFVVVI